MKIYDKITWHTDAGEEAGVHIQRFKVIFAYLNSHDMLSASGKEILEIGIDSETSLHTQLLNDNGKVFCEKNEDMLVGIDAATLNDLLNAMDYEEYGEYVRDIASYIIGYGDKYNPEVVGEINKLKRDISNDMHSLPVSEEEQKKALDSLYEIVSDNQTINEKMGK